MTSTAVMEKYGPVVAIVSSTSEPTKRYEVRHAANGTYSCQCMGWRFSKATPRDCRHTRATAMPAVASVDAAVVDGQVLVTSVRSRPAPLWRARTPDVRAVAAEAALTIASQTMAGRTVDVARATACIEEAIRKVLADSSRPLTVPAATVPMPVANGIRLITLDE